MKKELKKFQKVLSLNYSECFGSQKEVEEWKRSSREAFLKITLNFLRKMNLEELADRLQSSKRFSVDDLNCWVNGALMSHDILPLWQHFLLQLGNKV